MLKNHPNTAILIFAQSASKEARRKRWRMGHSIFRRLTNETLAKVRESGIAYVHYGEDLQSGNSFGKRFSNAVQTLFDQGYEKIITVGNDCPHLKATHLLEAAVALDKGMNVLLPATDGGFNLLGLQKEAFDPKEFEALPWQRATLCNATHDFLVQEQIDVLVLETLSDVDTVSDLATLLQSKLLVSKKLLQLLSVAFQQFFLGWISPRTTYQMVLLKIPSNKGSPIS